MSRMRKAVASGDGVPRARPSATKASGDSTACTACPNQETLRSRSKNKIPRSVRYDLENALVSLCDVWFEDIKPHLVRNNIKLHVHGSSAGGDHERQLPEEAPAQPARHAHPTHPAHLASTASSTPGCSHLDPGAAPDHLRPGYASYADSCSTLPTASRVLCRKPRTPNHQCPLPLLPSSPETPRDCTQTLSHGCEEKQLKRPRTRRKQRRPQQQPQPSWRVPRLCRTYSILTPATTGTHMRRIASHQPPQLLPRDDYYQFIVPRRSTMMKNKSTQTEEVLSRPCVSVGCQQSNPSPTLWSTSRERRAGPYSSARATKSLSPPRERIYQPKRPEPTLAEELPLFQDDLIDIIGERNDMKLRLLYSSPEQNDYPSLMNLFPLPNGRLKKSGGLKKSPPWR